MKRIFTYLLLLTLSLPASSQILVQNDFATYNGLASSVPAGWFYSWNDTASTSRSYYTSAGSCGMSCPAYKFGRDSVYMITPFFSGADSVRFYMKGNGTYKPNKFRVFGGADTSNWTLIHQFDSIPLASQTVTLPVGGAYNYLRFYYQKDSTGYNVGMDDIYIFAGIFTGVNEGKKFSASLYPNPTNGILNISSTAYLSKGMTILVSNVLGNEVKRIVLNNAAAQYQVNLNDLEAGIYMLRIRSEMGESTQRVVIRK